MGYENVTTIGGLNETWPLDTDPTNQGDNHLKTLKAVLKNIFPGAGGDGFTTPITATETEINYLSGASSNIQAQIDSLSVGGEQGFFVLTAPAGTRLLYDATNTSNLDNGIPSYWIQVINEDNRMVVIKSGTEVSAGDVNPTTMIHSHTCGGHALVAEELAAHYHHSAGHGNTWQASAQSDADGFITKNYDGGGPNANWRATKTDLNGIVDRPANPHDHPINQSNFRPRYRTMRLIEKTNEPSTS